MFTFGFGFASFVAAIIGVIFGWVVVSRGMVWSLSECVLEQSLDMSLSLFVWTTNNTIFVEEYKILGKSYGLEFTPMTLLFGITGIVMECFGSLVDYANDDIMFFAAVTMFKLTNEFRFKMVHDPSTAEEVLKHYKQLQSVSICMEESLGGLFKMSHASNLLSCAYCLLILVVHSDYNVGLIMLVLHIMKVWTTYYLTIKAASVVIKFIS